MKKLTVILITALLVTAVSADPTGEMTYFATHEGHLYVLRVGADNPIAQFDLPSDTEGLAFDGENWWMIKQPEETIYCFDYGGDYVTDFPAPAPNPYALAWDGDYLWVSCYLDKRADDAIVYQLATDGSAGPYTPFAIEGFAGLTVFGDEIVAMDSVGLTRFYTKSGTHERGIMLDISSGDENYSLTCDGEVLWSSVYEGADIFKITDFDPYTGEWLRHDIDPYGGAMKEGLAAGVWSYTGVEAESFGKIKTFFREGVRR
jgi:hypothetical protein